MMDHSFFKRENRLFDIFYFFLTYKYNDSFAADFTSFQVLPMFFFKFRYFPPSPSTNIFVFSLLQTPCGFQYRACLSTLLSFFLLLKTGTILFYFPGLIWRSMGCWLILFLRFVLDIFYSNWMLRQRFTKIWILLFLSMFLIRLEPNLHVTIVFTMTLETCICHWHRDVITLSYGESTTIL